MEARVRPAKASVRRTAARVKCVSLDERTVHRTRADAREPQDPLTGAPPKPLADASTTDAVPVRHLAHRIFEALS
jgi:hypothetical protein